MCKTSGNDMTDDACAGIPDPAAFVEAARGMMEAANEAVSRLNASGIYGTAEGLHEALTTFRATLGEAGQ